MACATVTILLVPTTTLRGAKYVSCRVFVVKIWVAVVASKVKTVQHGLRYSTNASGAHNDGPRCDVGQLTSLGREDLGGGVTSPVFHHEDSTADRLGTARRRC